MQVYQHILLSIRVRTPGKCLLEWDGGAGGSEPPPVPLLKDMFGSERRKAKVLNFSIAYGKTAHGLARDWSTSLQEAEATVERWYADRPEVRARSAPVSGRCKLRQRGQLGSFSGGPACSHVAGKPVPASAMRSGYLPNAPSRYLTTQHT